MYGAIDRGLNASRREEDSELLVVGACIQLLLHGFPVGRVLQKAAGKDCQRSRRRRGLWHVQPEHDPSSSRQIIRLFVFDLIW